MNLKDGVRSLLIFSLSILLGCTGKLRPDPVPISAIDANYPTAEIVAEGERLNGLGILKIVSGTPMADLNIYLQGYYKGTFTVDSENCQINEKFQYDGFALHKVTLRGTFQKSCFLDIVASHEWPEESSAGLKISAVKGRVWLIATSKQAFTKISKAKDTVGDNIFIPSSEPKIRVVFRGCNSKFDEKLDVFEGFAEVSLDSVIEMATGLRCGLVGAAIDAKTKFAIYWMAWIYDIQFTPLPVPNLVHEDKKLEIKADPGVSIIALDDSFKVSDEASFRIDWSKPHVLRLITVKGRLMIGEWHPDAKEWSWKR